MSAQWPSKQQVFRSYLASYLTTAVMLVLYSDHANESRQGRQTIEKWLVCQCRYPDRPGAGPQKNILFVKTHDKKIGIRDKLNPSKFAAISIDNTKHICSALDYIALQCTKLQWTSLYCTLNCTAHNTSALNCTALCNVVQCNVVQCTAPKSGSQSQWNTHFNMKEAADHKNIKVNLILNVIWS